MFVQTFATVHSCIPPFLTLCLFEPNCARNFPERAEGRGGVFKAPAKVMLLQLAHLQHKGVGLTGKGSSLITLQALMRLCKDALRVEMLGNANTCAPG